jgi:hypothetical protein
MRESTEGKRNGIQWTMLQQLDDLDFADDIVLISSTQQQMQEKTFLLAETSINLLSKAFSKSTKLRNKEVFHSNDCSIIIRSAAIWSVHDRSFLKPVCCSLSFSSTAFNSLVRSILFSTFLAIDYIMRESTEGKRNGIQWTMWQQLDDLDFTDNIAFISSTQQQMQEKTSWFVLCRRSSFLTLSNHQMDVHDFS